MCPHLFTQILSRYSLLRDLGSAFPAPVLSGRGENTDKTQQNKTKQQNRTKKKTNNKLFEMQSMSFPDLSTKQTGVKSEVQQMLVKSGSLLHAAIKCKN